MIDKDALRKRASVAKPDWRTPYGIVWTYIAKDSASNTFKIGHSIRLRKRLSVLHSVYPYCEYDFELIAFTPCNIEEYVQLAIFEAGGRLALPSTGTGQVRKELFSLDDSDIDAVIDAFKLQRTTDGMIPDKMKMTPNGKEECLFFKYDIESWVAPAKRRVLKRNGNG